jgi:hypothetical protein
MPVGSPSTIPFEVTAISFKVTTGSVKMAAIFREMAAIPVEPFMTPVEPGVIPFEKRAVVIEVDVVTIVSVPCRISVERRIGIIRIVHDDGSRCIFGSGRNAEIDMGADINLGITGGSYQASGYDHGGD